MLSTSTAFMVLFQSTLPMRGATLGGPIRPKPRIFQSTLLMRGATLQIRSRFLLCSISIHTPHAGSWYDISIHTPHAGSDPPSGP